MKSCRSARVMPNQRAPLQKYERKIQYACGGLYLMQEKDLFCYWYMKSQEGKYV